MSMDALFWIVGAVALALILGTCTPSQSQWTESKRVEVYRY